MISEITFSQPLDTEVELMLNYAKSFHLDTENLNKEQCILAKVKGDLVGFGRLRNHEDCQELSTIGVLPEYRGRGFGELIVAELVLRATNKPVYLATVLPGFFEKAGFKVIREDIPASIQLKAATCGRTCHSEDVKVMKKN